MVSFFVPLLLFFNFIFGPSYLIFIFLLALLPLYTFIFPYFVELANEEEPLF